MGLRALGCLAALLAACGCKGDAEQKAPPPPQPGHSDCDGNAGNGSETNTRTDPKHCGGCDRVCRAVHGTPACVEGRCKPSCESGFAACRSAEDGCTTELSTSRQHCGKCDAICLTGHCREGRCVEPHTVATGLAEGTALAFVVGEDVFVHRHISLPLTSGALWKVAAAGGKPARVTVPGMYPWVTDGKHLYGCKAPVNVLGSDCRVGRAPVAGGAVQELAVVPHAHMNQLAVDDAFVYVGVEGSKDRGSIVAVPIEGGPPRTIVEAGRIASIAATGGDVYWSSSGSPSGVFALPKETTGSIKLADALSFEVTVSGDHVYFADSQGLQRVPRKGGVIEWLAHPGARPPEPDGTAPSIDGIAIASGFVYFGVSTGRGDFEVRRIDVPKVSPTP